MTLESNDLLELSAAAEAAPVLMLSASSVDELEQLLAVPDDELLERIGQDPGDGSVRLGIVSPGARQLATVRKAVSRGAPWYGRGDVWFAPGPLLSATPVGSTTGKSITADPDSSGALAFICPGLEAEFAPSIDDVIEWFGLPGLRGLQGNAGNSADSASASLPERYAHAQHQGSAVLQVSRLLGLALRELGVEADALAGHSVGEWSAMALGGMFTSDALDEMLDRSESTVSFPGLAFAVIGASAADVSAALGNRPDVTLSHDNSPQQSMICGPTAEVDQLVDALQEQGRICRILPFSSGFHTPMFREYLGQLDEVIGGLVPQAATIPVWSATTVEPFPQDSTQIAEIFTRHLLEAVRFRELIENMYASGVRGFVQLGPGQLGTLIADTLRGREHFVVSANAPQRSGLDQLRCVLTALWACGRAVDLSFLGICDASFTDLSDLSDVRDVTAVAEPADPEPAEVLPAALISTDPHPTNPRSTNSLSANPLSANPRDRLQQLVSEQQLNPFLHHELEAYLQESDTAVADVLEAALNPVHAASARSGNLLPDHRTSAVPHSAPETIGLPAQINRLVTVSLETMPALADHSFVRQRPGWPEPADLFPVVPGTTIVTLLMEAAEDITGMRAVAVQDIHLDQWVEASYPQQVEITGERVSADWMAMSFGSYAHARVQLAPEYPQTHPAPETAAPDEPQDVLPMTAAEAYSKHWLFHGPRYQGLLAFRGIGEHHIRATVTAREGQGSLLDTIGQLAGFWLMARFTERATVFPIAAGGLRFYGPEPPRGSELECALTITEVTDRSFHANGRISWQGRLWCEITGWRERRFDSPPNIRQLDERIEHCTVAEPQAGGWMLLPDHWPDLASREITLRKYLGRAERAEHESSPPRGRRQLLLGRIVAKDAVRRLLWQQPEQQEAIFPAEIGIGHRSTGSPYPYGLHGRELPEISLSIAHSQDLGVALAISGGELAGIDVEQLAERPESFLEVAFTPAERTLLQRLEASSSTSDTALGTDSWAAFWRTGLFCAKEAVGKACGTGLAGEPQSIKVLSAEASSSTASPEHVLTVRHPAVSGEVTVRLRLIRHTAPAPTRAAQNYLVAWTTIPADRLTSARAAEAQRTATAREEAS
ncbi:acyltransferase domain-containing protein [Acaricomes phytoseiuli]|uniref:acyltransferase domain-containing protein n=1 Tax=Acaricomes phytoseiuli TaxID=291968 RepID=UPI0022235D4D|nr:acyltransferase domain-containing protein [Acaricomes phytoseiuli]MCW1249514.1 acyltransferase domain-containing protein [Acaricomes phytoseiuli]